MGELANCPRCNALFVKDTRQVCHNCFKEEEKAFETVYHFLREQKNRQSTIPQIVEATDVEEDLIVKFVKERRLRTTHFPNLAYPCEKCGNDIVEGKLCTSCATELISELERQEQIDRLAENRKEKERATTYFSIQKEK
ncbi:hypothetical protein NC797_01005 [Aquibacillus sp. 3ASR75-11]|uniref:Flagellar operon protein (TIGR03826 family) n=1 Tax=Terrihalobacillus insolitus TaxID=2950438 RepID=A0A9X4AKQ8_9BACI|nr:TIGR03826 family flagellar region protein [Terrihalobacillus insolitus]MDC3412222.1 hypothetical protein [Terrihalobacillus insolitus]MDC3423084.1 hypothetical protein [Terrihalobacillus insolitus]